MPRRPLFPLLLAALFCCPMAMAQAPGIDFGFGAPQEEEYGDSRDQVTISTELSQSTAPAGADVVLAIVLEMPEDWHIWPGPDEDNEYEEFEDAVRTTLSLPAGEAGAITPHLGFATWPEIHGTKADVGDGLKTYGVYEGRAVILVPITIAMDASEGTYDFQIDIDFQACDQDTCLQPATTTLDVKLIVGIDTTEPADSTEADFAGFDPTVFADIRGGATAPERIDFDAFGWEFTIDANGAGGFLLLLLVAAIGGFLLNLTPCVLPVIPLKIMGLSAVAGNRMRCFLLGVSMSLGVIVFWMILGGLIAGIKSFEAISQLFQYPLFTIGVGAIIIVMAVGMAGFFTIRLPNKIYSIQTNHESMTGSFLFGIMTAVLSTPCTAPLMGAAAAWATTQSPGTVLLVFASIGTGMAFPYLVLSAFPALVEKMPRTGAASELVKQVMGLLLLAAGVYFVGSGIAGILVTPPDPPTRMYWWIVAVAGVGAGAWLAWRTPQVAKKYAPRIVFCVIGGLIIWFSGYLGVRMTSKGPIDWVYYTPERFTEAVAEKKVIMLDFTAEWCLNCKTLEATSLSQQSVVDLSEMELVVAMKIDLTGNNPDGRAKLSEENRLTIPLLVVYGKDGIPVFKSDAYTGNQVTNAIGEAASTLGIDLQAASP